MQADTQESHEVILVTEKEATNKSRQMEKQPRS